MLNILAISETGEGYGLARVLTKERNFVKFYSGAETGRGIKLPKKIDSIEEETENSDIVLCCQNTPAISKGAQRLASMGRFVIGSAGLYSKLLDINFLNSLYNLIDKPIVEATEDYDYEVWGMFNGDVWLPFYIINSVSLRINDKKGARCTSTGNCVKISDTFAYSRVFEGITGFLKKSGFVGFMGFKFISGAFAGICTSLNIGMFYALKELLYIPFTELLLSLISGEVYKPKCREGFGISVMLSLPPYPYICPFPITIKEYLNLNEDILKHLVLEDIVEEASIQSSGTFGLLGWATAFGITTREARRRAYRTINNVVKVREIQYTPEVGVNADIDFSFAKEEKNAITEGKIESNTIS